jgi:hypothetical protein
VTFAIAVATLRIAVAILTGKKKAPCGEGLAISYKGE